MASLTIDNAGVTLHVERDGQPGAPAVLLLHGITNNVDSWGWIVPHLNAHHEVFRLDFRGHGRSARAEGTYQFASYLSDAIAVCEQAIGRPCVVVGHSLGGATAASLAQARPDLTRAIVLEDAPLGTGDATKGNSLRTAFATMRQSIPRLQQRGISAEDLAHRLAAAPSPTGPVFSELLLPDGLLAMATALLQMDASVLDPVLDGTNQPRFDPERPIPVPTLVLAADPVNPDAVVRPHDVETLRRVSPTAEVVVVAGAGHLIHDERANRPVLLGHVQRFLEALPA